MERPKGDKSEAPQISRLEKKRRELKDDTWEPEMPPVDAGGYLVGYLFEAGPTMPGGMGPAILSWAEIGSWQARTGTPLQPWEARFLRRLSAEYLWQSRDAEKLDCPAPWKPAEVEPEQLAATADAMRNAMRRLAAH